MTRKRVLSWTAGATVVAFSLFVMTRPTPVLAAESIKIYYYHSDHLGSTNIVTDERGQVVQKIEYTPFGTPYKMQGQNVSPHKFTGKRFDESSGFYYYGARYYDPELGRFIQPDSIVQAPSDPQTLNRYTYCRNNPLIFTDPSGHSFWKSIKKFFENWGNIVSPLGRAIITGEWKSLGNTLLSTATAFVFSGFNPVVAAATFITYSALDTKAGWEATKFEARYWYDNVFGMNPRMAYLVTDTVFHVAGSLVAEWALSSLVAQPAAGMRDYKPGDIPGKPKGNYTWGKIPGGENVPGRVGFDPGQMTTLTNQSGDALAVVGKSKIEPGLLEILHGEAVHTGAIAKGFPGSGVEKLVPDTWYGTCFGTCHQATNATLLSSGISNTVTDVAPDWSTFTSTVVYGNYGGGLPRTIVGAATASHRESE